MRQPPKPITPTLALLTLALAFTACSNTTTNKPKATIAKSTTIPFKSPAVLHGKLSARYTCDGKNIAPPLQWGNVPPGTSELAILILGAKPSTSNPNTNLLSIEWAIAGINPTLHQLTPGHLPAGIHTGTTHAGKPQRYSLCPTKHTTQTYQFALYAIPAPTKIPPKFEAIQLLEHTANPESPTAAKAGGSFLAKYTRK